MNRKELADLLNNTKDMMDLSKEQLVLVIDMLVDVIEEYERRYVKITSRRR